MKKLILILSIVILPVISNAQDRMIKTDNTILTVKIFEIGEDIIRYKPFDKQEGPMFSINRSTVHKVILESGDEFVYNPLMSTQTQTVTQNPPPVTSNPVVSSTTTQSQVQSTDENGYLNAQNIRTAYTSFANVDFSNTGNVSGDDENEPAILIMEAGTFNLFFPMADSDIDDDIEGSHGIIARGSLRMALVEPPTSLGFGGSSTTSFIVDVGIGYGYNYKTDLRAFAALNTALFFNSSTFVGGDEITINEWFPSDSGSLRLGLFWTPFGKNTRWGPYVAFDSFFAEGADNAFYIGFSVK